MTTPIDRAALEKAIARAKELGDLHEAWECLVAAARAHLATLPREKEVERYHVEHADSGGNVVKTGIKWMSQNAGTVTIEQVVVKQ